MADTNKIARRTFLSGLGLAAAAGVAARISSRAPAGKALGAVATEPAGGGYRLTEHVKKYYRTTTI
ncbi:hypothetical protein [Herminiimonas sp. CN]|uniref:hypothetical protein n=1 Tax=Herminiimonas sp. CN TaxID=1349818 RepID=UPI000473CFD7|nr:hypothetical protein [Herminiimonas sp. CN]